MKIRKYQAGAIIYTPTPLSNPAISAQASADSSKSKSSAHKVGDVQKEIMGLLKEDGLPSDVDRLLKEASVYLDKSSRLTDMSLLGGSDTDYDIKDYIKILRKVQEAKFNREEYDDASTNLTKEGAWGNAAMNSTGDLWAIRKDENGQTGIGTVDLKEYTENRDKYRILTNGELMEMRARYPSLAFDQKGILHHMQEAKGMKSVSDQLRGIINDFQQKKIQYYKYSKGADSFLDKSGNSYNIQELSDGLDMLTKGGPSGYYKMTNSSNVQDMNRAVSYLWNSLDESMKNIVKAQLATHSQDPFSEKQIYQFLAESIYEGTESTQAADFDNSATKYDPEGTGKKGGSEKGDQLTQMNYLAEIAAGYYGSPISVSLIGKTSTVTKAGGIKTKGYDLGAMIDHNKKTLDKQTVSSLLGNAWGLQAGNTGSITFGDRHITAEEAQALYWNGADHLYAVDLPVTTDDNGNIMPDFKVSQYVKELNEKAKGHSELEVKNYAKEHYGLDAKKNDKGVWEFVGVKTMTFLTFTATGSDKIFDFTDDEKLMLDHVDKKEGKLIKKIYNKLTQFNTLTPTSNTVRLEFDDAGANSFYKGNVYIPIDNQYAGFRVSGMDPYVTKDSLSNPAEKIALREAVVDRNNSGRTLNTNFRQ